MSGLIAELLLEFDSRNFPLNLNSKVNCVVFRSRGCGCYLESVAVFQSEQLLPFRHLSDCEMVLGC